MLTHNENISKFIEQPNKPPQNTCTVQSANILLLNLMNARQPLCCQERTPAQRLFIAMYVCSHSEVTKFYFLYESNIQYTVHEYTLYDHSTYTGK